MSITSKTAQCDRCSVELDISDEHRFTSGYYDTTSILPGSWKQIAEATDSEKRICDKCMWKSPGYIKIYGNLI